MALLVLAAGFTFGGHLSIWTIYELKQQFTKLAPWNMHWPTVHWILERYIGRVGEGLLRARNSSFGSRIRTLPKQVPSNILPESKIIILFWKEILFQVKE